MSLNLVLASLACAAFASVLLEGAAGLRWAERWAERNIVVSMASLARAARLVVPTVLGAGAALVWQSTPAAFTVAGCIWLAAVAVDTDLTSRKIPKEPCWAVFFLGTAGGVAAFTWYGALAALTAFLLIGFILLLLALLTRGGLGSGDVRLLVGFTPLAWWTGLTPLLMGLAVAGIIQIGVRLVMAARHKPSRRLPFGPALVLGTLLSVVGVTIWGIPTYSNACVEWLACAI